VKGGCLCGQVRYTVEADPIAVATCHCLNCQKQSGSALSLVVVIRRDTLALTGTLRTFEDRGETGQPVYRRFCPQCGSPVITDTPAAAAHGVIFIKGGTVDDAYRVLRPGRHYWTKRLHDWLPLPSGDIMLSRQEES
jgi:hypothetical protein